MEHETMKKENTDYLDALDKTKGLNRDADGLGTMPIAGGQLTIGAVDAINGVNGQEVPEYAPTRNELVTLAEHWFEERLDGDLFWAMYRQGSSSGWRWSTFIGRRLERLQGILGEKGMDEAFENASKRRRKLAGMSDEDWKIFRTGTEAEQDAWRERIERDAEKVLPAEREKLLRTFGAADADANKEEK